MNAFQSEVETLFKVADAATTNPAKGKAFEDLVCYVFESIPGLANTQRNAMNVFDTEEIDVAFWNEQDPAGLKSFNPMVLVECKNWSSRVGSIEVSWFLAKIEHRGLDFGVLVAVNGITGNANDITAAHHTIAVALAKKIRLIVIDRTEIEALDSGTALVKLIKDKMCRLIVSGSAW